MTVFCTIDPIAYIWGRQLNDNPDPNQQGPLAVNYDEDAYLVYTTDMTVIPAGYENNAPFNSDGVLSSCQSFFIQPKNEIGFPENNTGATQLASNSLIFNNSMRTILSNNTFQRQSSSIGDDKLWLSIETDETSAQMGVAFLSHGEVGYDSKQDAKTFNRRALNIYSKTTPQDLMVDIQDSFNTNKTIPLGITNMTSLANQSLTLKMYKKGGVFATQVVYLEDKYLNIVHNLTESEYLFQANSGIMDNRFTLKFSSNLEFSNTEKNETTKNENTINVFTQDNNIIINTLYNRKIESVTISDLYNVNKNGISVLKKNKINKKIVTLKVNGKHKLLHIKIRLNDGTIFTQKILR